MRRGILIAGIVALTLIAAGQPPRRPSAPRDLTFPARPGNVLFHHAGHAARVKGDCKSCHNALFPPDSTAPLNWKQGMHRPAEARHTSCGACHHPGGPAFATKDNCHRCHTAPPEL